MTTSPKTKSRVPTKRKLLTHYRFLTTNLAGSEVVKMKSQCSDYIKNVRKRLLSHYVVTTSPKNNSKNACQKKKLLTPNSASSNVLKMRSLRCEFRKFWLRISISILRYGSLFDIFLRKHFCFVQCCNKHPPLHLLVLRFGWMFLLTCCLWNNHPHCSPFYPSPPLSWVGSPPFTALVPCVLDEL